MIRIRFRLPAILATATLILVATHLSAAPPPPVPVEGQPLAGNALRLAEALEYLGAPRPPAALRNFRVAARSQDAQRIQTLLDPRVLLVVSCV